MYDITYIPFYLVQVKVSSSTHRSTINVNSTHDFLRILKLSISSVTLFLLKVDIVCISTSAPLCPVNVLWISYKKVKPNLCSMDVSLFDFYIEIWDNTFYNYRFNT